MSKLRKIYFSTSLLTLGIIIGASSVLLKNKYFNEDSNNEKTITNKIYHDHSFHHNHDHNHNLHSVGSNDKLHYKEYFNLKKRLSHKKHYELEEKLHRKDTSEMEFVFTEVKIDITNKRMITDKIYLNESDKTPVPSHENLRIDYSNIVIKDLYGNDFEINKNNYPIIVYKQDDLVDTYGIKVRGRFENIEREPIFVASEAKLVLMDRRISIFDTIELQKEKEVRIEKIIKSLEDNTAKNIKFYAIPKIDNVDFENKKIKIKRMAVVNDHDFGLDRFKKMNKTIELDYSNAVIEGGFNKDVYPVESISHDGITHNFEYSIFVEGGFREDSEQFIVTKMHKEPVEFAKSSLSVGMCNSNQS